VSPFNDKSAEKRKITSVAVNFQLFDHTSCIIIQNQLTLTIALIRFSRSDAVAQLNKDQLVSLALSCEEKDYFALEIRSSSRNQK